jgi:hypothetical protein
MSQPLFESLQNSSSLREFTFSIREIINKNDPALRVKEIIPIILGKKQLILENSEDQQQQMIQSVGDLFLWLELKTPSEEKEIECEIFSAAYEFCATPEVEAFVLEVMIPNAFKVQTIVTTARTVSSLVRFENEMKLFSSPAATKQLLKMAARAPTQEALAWTFGAIRDITSTLDDSVLQSYLTEGGNAELLLKAFIRAEDGMCIDSVAQVLLNISFCKSCVSQISTPEFRSAVLGKLSTTKSCGVVARLCGFIANVSAACAESARFFCAEEAMKILLRKLGLVDEDKSAKDFFGEIGRLSKRAATGNLSAKIAFEPLNFALKEFCAAIVRCFDFVTMDEDHMKCVRAISTVSAKCECSRLIFSNVPNLRAKVHDAIKQMEHLWHNFDKIDRMCQDKESARLFANRETLLLLLDCSKKITNVEADDEVDYDSLYSIYDVLDNIVSHFPEFLDFCTARLDLTSESQLRLLKEVTTLEELATFLENEFDDLFECGNQIFRRCSLLDVCEKLDQFILLGDENKNNEEFQKALLRICDKFRADSLEMWEEILNHRCFDDVVLSILQHGTGKTCLRAALLIFERIEYRNPRACLSSSMLKVILEKMDEGDEETCFAHERYDESFFSWGLRFLRHAVSENSKDLSKTFFVDNLNLINRVLKKGYLLGDVYFREEVFEALDQFRKVIPRMTHAPQIFIEKESGQRRDRDGNPSTME